MSRNMFVALGRNAFALGFAPTLYAIQVRDVNGRPFPGIPVTLVGVKTYETNANGIAQVALDEIRANFVVELPEGAVHREIGFKDMEQGPIQIRSTSEASRPLFTTLEIVGIVGGFALEVFGLMTKSKVLSPIAQGAGAASVGAGIFSMINRRA